MKNFWKKLGKMIKSHWLTLVLIVILVLIVGIGLLVKYGMEKAQADEILAKFPDRGIPRLNITLNGVSLEEINAGSKDAKYEGNELAVYEGDKMTLEAGEVRVKGRGNMTWLGEKKPYQLKFANKTDMFGMGKAKKWVLLANALDATNLRTATAFYLEEMLEMKPAFKGEFVELYVDNESVGLYYLTHAVEIDKQSVDLKDPMGVLVELDNLYGLVEQYYKTGNGDVLVIKDKKNSDMGELAMEGFLVEYNEFEKAVAERDYDRLCELVDVESFAKYYLLSEFTVNPDAYWTSFYMYKDGNNDKIHAGPGWDFDLALANRAWGNWLGEDFYSSKNTMIRKREIMTKEMYEEMGLALDVVDWHGLSLKLSHLLFDMMEMSEFQNLVRRLYVEQMRWQEYKLIQNIEQEARAIEEAVMADEKEWVVEGFWQEIDTMKRWIGERYEYFDEVYGNMEVLIDANEQLILND